MQTVCNSYKVVILTAVKAATNLLSRTTQLRPVQIPLEKMNCSVHVQSLSYIPNIGENKKKRAWTSLIVHASATKQIPLDQYPDLKRWDPTVSIGNVFSGITAVTNRKFLPKSNLNLHCCNLNPLLFSLLPVEIENSLSSPLQQSLTCLKTVVMSPLRLFLSSLNKPNSFGLSSYITFSGPLIILVALVWSLSSWFTSFLKCSAQNCEKYSSGGLTVLS